MSNNIFYNSSINKLANIVEIAKENSLAVSIDYCADLWILQIFDLQERLIITANDKNPNFAINKLFDGWMARTSLK